MVAAHQTVQSFADDPTVLLRAVVLIESAGGKLAKVLACPLSDLVPGFGFKLLTALEMYAASMALIEKSWLQQLLQPWRHCILSMNMSRTLPNSRSTSASRSSYIR